MDARESAIYAHPAIRFKPFAVGVICFFWAGSVARDGSSRRSGTGDFIFGNFGEVDIVFGMVDSVGSSR